MKLNLENISILLLSLCMIACGFQLRGSINADFESIAIYGGSEGLNKHLSKRFKQAGIKVESNDPEKTLEILSDQLNKRIMSLNNAGAVKEYEISYHVTYRFKSINKSWSNEIKKEVIRDFTYDDNDRVAKELEEKKLVQGMRDEVVRSIVSLISTSD